MRKFVFLLVVFIFNNMVLAQKYVAKTGKVSFEASVPLFEDVYARDDNSIMVLNLDTGDIATISNVKNFHFKTKLMEEHFNESYAETAKYPKTTFTGKILNFDKTKLSEIPQKYTIEGRHSFHGVARNISSIATIYFKNNIIGIQGNFIARPVDYNVKIPKMVTKKVAENVNVQYNYTLSKQ